MEPIRNVRRLMSMMLKTRTLKAYAIALGLLWLYVIAGIFFAQVCYPGALAGDEPSPKSINIRFAP